MHQNKMQHIFNDDKDITLYIDNLITDYSKLISLQDEFYNIRIDYFSNILVSFKINNVKYIIEALYKLHKSLTNINDNLEYFPKLNINNIHDSILNNIDKIDPELRIAIRSQ